MPPKLSEVISFSSVHFSPRRFFVYLIFALLILSVLFPLTFSGHPSLAEAASAPVSANANAPQAGLPIATTTVLYDGSIVPASLPDTQGLKYGALNSMNPPLFTAQATQTLSGTTTILDSTAVQNDYAGYGGDKTAVPKLPSPLDRTTGYRLDFTVKIFSESHASNDRAGFSVLLISQDLKGIELGFWTGNIWAQNSNFTHGSEDASFNTTSGLISYSLSILGDNYALYSGTTLILAGALRDYSGNPRPPLVPPQYWPYTTPSFIFLGDDTTSASAKIALSVVSITTNIGLLVTSTTDTSAVPPVLPVTLRQAVANAPASGAVITFDPVLGAGPQLSLNSLLSLPANLQIQAASCATPAKLIFPSSAGLKMGGNNLLHGLQINIAPGNGPALQNTGLSKGNKLECTKAKVQ